MDTFLDISMVDPEVQARKDAELREETEAQIKSLSDDKGVSVKQPYNEIYQCVLYQLEVQRAYLDPKISLDKLSTVIGTNTTYLSNTINRFFGCNLRQLINSYRIKYACRLLESGEYDVHDVYSKAGFASQSVFYSAFSREMGISPLRYLASHNFPFNLRREVAGFYESSPQMNTQRVYPHEFHAEIPKSVVAEDEAAVEAEEK
jgi:AraC-like DNA-binding protein